MLLYTLMIFCFTHKPINSIRKVYKRFSIVFVTLTSSSILRNASFDQSISAIYFRLTPEGILTGSDKLKGVREIEPPTSVTQVWEFLGLCNFFRTHAKNFSTIVAPLNSLTSKKTGWLRRKLTLLEFDKLKSTLISNPVVLHPHPNKPFSLIVDAETGGTDTKGSFGAILFQPDDNSNLQVVAYANRSLKDHEKNYAPFLAEMNVAAWGIDHFDVCL